MMAIVAERGTPPLDVVAAVAEAVGLSLDGRRVFVARYDTDSAATLVAGWSSSGGALPVGLRFDVEEGGPADLVRRTGRPARVDAFAPGSAAERTAQMMGIESVVAAPLIVRGRLWGLISVGSTADAPPPPRTEQRLAGLTELVATAIANSQAIEQLAELVDEQAALHRVATLVAQDAAPDEIFAAVSAEVDRVFGLDPATFDVAGVVRFEPGPDLVVVGVSKSVEAVPLGSHFPANELFAPTHVLRTGRSARVGPDDLEAVGGDVADFLRHHGYLSQVASPIVVNGSLWGAISVNATSDFPADTEDRLGRFTELVATAISNAEAHRGLQRIAMEQEALRSAATLVAAGAPPTEVFAAITASTSEVFGVPFVSLVRREPDATATMVAGCATCRDYVGVTWVVPDDDAGVVGSVVRAEAPVRVEDHSHVHGPLGEAARTLGVGSVVGAPVMVGGRVWGVLAAGAATLGPSLGPDAGERLARFAELVSTAIVNTEARDQVHRLIVEQAALQRVATLVAEAVPSADLFAAVTTEAAHVFSDVDATLVATVIRFDPGPECVLVGRSRPYEREPLGARWAPRDLYVSTRVLRSGSSARVEEAELDASGGPDADVLRLRGFLYQVGSPVVVEGQLWGAMTLNSRHELPPDTDDRLERFTELVATAIANAESRGSLAELAQEQAALRRVATIVARGAPPGEIFSAVAEEVGGLLGPDHAVMARFDGPDVVSIVAEWTSTGDPPRLENRRPLSAGGIAKIVQDTGRPARVDDYVSAARGRQSWVLDSGTRAAVAAPITVDGRLWGVMGVGSRGAPPPAGTEARLVSFTELVATAIANTEARHALERVAAQQAALRRVATLVAQAAAPQDLFDAVAEEVGRLLPAANVSMGRYESDDTVTSMASWSSVGPTFPLGVRWPIKGTNVAWMVLQTGTSARVDDFSVATDPIGVAVREAGYTSAVGSPIVVEGQLWGVISAASTEGRMPPDSEARLASFTELVATALANAEARAQVERLAEEQAALRRVATLVAGGAEPREIFSAVSDEVGRLFGTRLAAVGRFELDAGSVRTFFSLGAPLDLVGTDRWEVVDYLATADVLRTGRSARAEAVRWESEEGETAERLRRLGVITTVASPIVVEGELWGAMLVASTDAQLPGDTEERLERFTELVATAIANAESSAELSASRRRIVAAADDARRRIERDLHDGVQQRLVSLGLELGVMGADPPVGDALKEQLASVTEDVRSVLDGLVELARGIHPAILSRGGLAAALKALARRSAVPVELDAQIEGPIPDDVEVAAYYVAAEALTNAAKHAHASVVHMDATSVDGTLTLTVRDDGVGGAKPGGGSGLVGLRDRVEALGGTIKITSSAGSGTCIAVTLPIATEPDGEIDPFLGQP